MYYEFAEKINFKYIDIICKMLGCRIEDFVEAVYEDNDKNN